MNVGRRRQLDTVRGLMLLYPGLWWCLVELHDVTGYPEASISARLRDLRKMGYIVDRRRDPVRGTWLYRVVEG